MEAPGSIGARESLRNTLRRFAALVENPSASEGFLQLALTRLRVLYLELLDLSEAPGSAPLAGGDTGHQPPPVPKEVPPEVKEPNSGEGEPASRGIRGE